MSIQLSRRDFMKCSAVAVLAAASGTLLTGCSGGGSGIGIAPNQKVTLKSVDVVMSNIDHNLTIKVDNKGISLLDFTFTVSNPTSSQKQILTSIGEQTDHIIETILKCQTENSLEPLKSLAMSPNFTVKTDVGEAYAYIDYSSCGIYLDPYQSGTVHICCAVPSDWNVLSVYCKHLDATFVHRK